MPGTPGTSKAVPSSAIRSRFTPQKWPSTRSTGLPWRRSSSTGSVHHSGSGVPRSRSMKRPVAWSIWPSISTTPAIAVSRWARAGCITLLLRICSRMSGEALNRMPSALSSGRMKIDDCVRAFARTAPARTPAQLRQLQFHCGKPPPAAAPSTVMRMNFSSSMCKRPGGCPGRCQDYVRTACDSARCNVHRDFEAEAEITGLRGGPLHKCLLCRCGRFTGR